MLIEKEISCDEEKFFLQALLVFIKKPQLVNKKLSHSKNVSCSRMKCSDDDKEIFDNLRSLYTTSEHIISSSADYGSLETFEDGKYLIVNQIEPRDLKKFKSRTIAIIIDFDNKSAKFSTVNDFGDKENLCPSSDFSFSCSSNKLTLSYDPSDPSSNWLRYVLFVKLQNWMKNGDNHGGQNPLKLESHSLIDSDSFNETYTRLKEKYGKPLEDQWNETTDPKKFVYEDIAISTYLIVLWKQERIKLGTEKLQSFVDLGCGNGLLVHILSGEGHRGYGIDLRRRKIWDILKADLREFAIVPSDDHLYADVDWLIGNHSDELSPWIPVISARSSYNSNYFLLPCCAYEFAGIKFSRKGVKSQYLSFVDYLLQVSKVCGFKETNLDRMKIPSTKRICLIGTGRIYDENVYASEKLKIQDFIDKSNGDIGNNDKWSESFKPREKLQEVRNCIRIDNNLKESIWRRIFDQLLSKSDEFHESYPEWNKGGEMTIPEVVELVTQDELKQLKSEFGGIQTLLKNKHQIFHVYGGTVRIRLPRSLSELELDKKKKKKPINKRTATCYFFQNHYSGCPLDDSECPYQHC